MSRKAKGKGFTQRSGKSPAFKMIGSSPMQADNRNDWFMRKTGGGDWEKVMRKPRGVATGHGSGGYTDDWGETATTGIDEFDAKVRSAKASRRRDAASRWQFPINENRRSGQSSTANFINNSPDTLSNLTNFKMRSGNTTPFKQMGSGTYNDAGIYQASTDGMKVGSREYADARAVNRTWTNPQGVTMYRHPDGNSSSIAYDPAKVGVAVRGDNRGYFDYKGQAATSGIEGLKNRQNRGGRRLASQAGKLGISDTGTFDGTDTLSNLSTKDFWSQYSF